ncbi:MAG: polyketide synthase, partial [Polyangiaceae bacterium]|nr:polyketide synthase [Polyangiaceae bacterium]
LAHHRAAQGLPGVSLAWGYWSERGALTAHLRDADVERIARLGVEPLSRDAGLALFDAALELDLPLVVPARFDLAALRSSGGTVPPVLRGLVPVGGRGGAARTPDLAQKLRGLEGADRERAVLDVVRAEIAAVFRLPGSISLDPARPLTDVGMDSLLALEVRNRLGSRTGLRLPATLLFDYPTPQRLAARLNELIGEAESAPAPDVLREIERLESLLDGVAGNDSVRAAASRRLEHLLSRLAASSEATKAHDPSRDLLVASDEELFAFIDDHS